MQRAGYRIHSTSEPPAVLDDPNGLPGRTVSNCRRAWWNRTMVGEVTGMSNEEQAEAFTWRALQKTLSDGRMRIRVVGTCDRPMLPLRANLSRAAFQPSNPNILLLAFKSEILGSAVAQHAPTVTIAYEQTSSRRYKLVSIQPGGIGIAVEEEA